MLLLLLQLLMWQFWMAKHFQGAPVSPLPLPAALGFGAAPLLGSAVEGPAGLVGCRSSYIEVKCAGEGY